MRLRPQEAVQLRLGQWEAAPVSGVQHVHQDVSPPQVFGPVAAQVLTASNCSREKQRIREYSPFLLDSSSDFNVLFILFYRNL